MSTLTTDSDSALAYLTNKTTSAEELVVSPPNLPGVSSKFFTLANSPANFGAIQPDSFIFFGRSENRPPYKLQKDNFSLAQRRSSASIPLATISKPASVSEKLDRESAKMSATAFDNDENSYKSLKNIAEGLGLNKEEMRRLSQDAIKLISHNEQMCRKTPRPWRSQVWKDFVRKFLHDSNRGQRLWSSGRPSSCTEDDLSWPEDEQQITFLTFMLFKIECAKYFSKNTKRKAASENALQSKTKKSKSVETNDDEDSDSDEDTPQVTKGSVNETTEEDDTTDEEHAITGDLIDGEDASDPFRNARAASKNLEALVSMTDSASAIPNIAGTKRALSNTTGSVSPMLGSTFSMGEGITLDVLTRPTFNEITQYPSNIVDNQPLQFDTHTNSSQHLGASDNWRAANASIEGYSVLTANALPNHGMFQNIATNDAILSNAGEMGQDYRYDQEAHSKQVVNTKDGMSMFPAENQLQPIDYSASGLPITPVPSHGRFQDALHHQSPTLHRSAVPAIDQSEMIFCVYVEGMKMSPSRLMTFSRNGSFAEFFGQTMLECSNHARARVANAGQCKVQIPGETQMVFAVQNTAREKMWTALMQRASRAIAQQDGDGLIEVEFSGDTF